MQVICHTPLPGGRGIIVSGRRSGDSMKTATPGAGRIIGVDLARCLALIAMYVAHVAPSAGPAGILNLSEFATAPLFALLMGVSAYLSTERMSFPVLFASSVVRGIMLIAIGLYINTWDAHVDIVLPYLGVLSVLIAPLVFLPAWLLGVISLLSWWFATTALTYFTPAYNEQVLSGSYLQYAYQWFFTGTHYQVFTLLAYACVGGILARALGEWGAVGDTVTAIAATGVAGLIYWYATTELSEFLPYTASRLEIAFALFLSIAALGWSCLLARIFASRAQVLDPLVAAGRMTLSLYVLQIGVLALYIRYAPAYGLPYNDDSWWMLVLLIALSLLFAWSWDRLLGRTIARRGPLESLLALVTGRS